MVEQPLSRHIGTRKLYPVKLFRAPNFGRGCELFIELITCLACNGTGKNQAYDSLPKWAKKQTSIVCPNCLGRKMIPRSPPGVFWLKLKSPTLADLPPKHRPHLTYTLGRVGKIWRRKIPRMIRVQFYVMAIWLDRPNADMKAKLMKPILSFVENILAS